jgi:hypothetical protein
MLIESRVEASAISKSGAYIACAELCPDCPRRTGEIKVKAKGVMGLLGKRVTQKVHDNPLRSGVIETMQTNGRHGVFYGTKGENTGTVTHLKEYSAKHFLESIMACDGPRDKGNTCSALGTTSLNAICDLDTSMERQLDMLPIESLVESLAGDSTKVDASDIATDTVVFINNSRPTAE